MHWSLSFVFLDMERSLIGLHYRYASEEDVYILEIGLFLMYITLGLKSKKGEE